MMISQCNFIPETIWVRGIENGIRHITLRRNFTEETVIHEEIEEIMYIFEETDVFIPDRENINDFITQNFGNLFELGLQQMVEKSEKEVKVAKTKQIIQEGTLIDDVQLLGQQITNLMLGV
jgi:hypothetical protein